MITVNAAHKGDVLSVAQLARNFWALTDFGDIEYCPDSVIKVAQGCHADGLLFLACDDGKPVGFLAGRVSPLLANHAHQIGSEVAWWVEPEYRRTGIGMELIALAELKSRELGLVAWCMMNLQAVEPEATDRLYSAAGYALSEQTYIKRLVI